MQVQRHSALQRGIASSKSDASKSDHRASPAREHQNTPGKKTLSITA
jgi:hypothetical protein